MRSQEPGIQVFIEMLIKADNKEIIVSWTHDDPAHWQIYASPDQDSLHFYINSLAPGDLNNILYK